MSDVSNHQTFEKQREAMVRRQIQARGIRAEPVLRAMARVPREAFLPEAIQEFAYEDSPLPIGEQQTISQPYIVAYMTDALNLQGGERVLEVGTGSGYAAAVLAEIAREVYTVERHEILARQAEGILRVRGYDNVRVIHGDGTRGWPEAAPYDAIVVAAGGPAVPDSLKHQLAIGGRLVIPVGTSSIQALVRVTRVDENEFREEQLTGVRFVPLVGDEGWEDPGRKSINFVGNIAEPGPEAEDAPSAAELRRPRPDDTATPALITSAAQPIDDLDSVSLDMLLARIGPARVVLIGEASHGTSEFYRFRARITRELIEKQGFNLVAVEADWPDASRIDHYVQHREVAASEWTAFSRFPTWMWRNEEVREFVDWLREHNAGIDDPGQRVGFHGLDLYSLYTSIHEVLEYLSRVDPEAARVARERYGCLTPWQSDPATYGRAAVSGRYRECQTEVVAMLGDLLKKRLDYAAEHDGSAFLNAVQNARLVTNAERYYRSLYEGFADSWNLRDGHMFETLRGLLEQRGSDARAVVWAHNSHLGDASATDMAARGEYNLGQLCRQTYGNGAYLIGFGTHGGTVAAASNWDGPMEVREVRPSLPESWERLCHDAGIPAFMLGLGHTHPGQLRERLLEQALERAIGVIYRPETERFSHYFMARLAAQFDEYIWFDQTRAVTPLDTRRLDGMPETYPFAT